MHALELRRLVWPLAVAAGLFVSLPAIAADLNSEHESSQSVLIPDVPNHRWDGVYVGVSLGASGGGGRIEKDNGTGTFDHDAGSAGFGGHVGYNFGRFGGAANGGWMLGTEFDIAGAAFEGDKTDALIGKTKLDGSFLASWRLRAGYAWDNTFLYGTVGLGFSDMTLEPVGLKDSGHEIRSGVAFGAGIEIAVAEQWTARVEGIGYDFGDQTHKFNGVERKVELGTGTIRLGVSRQF